MLVTNRSTYQVNGVTQNQDGVATDCNSLTLDNYGEDDVKIYFNNTDPEHPEEIPYMLLKAGKSIDLGGSIDSIIIDTLDFVFLFNVPQGAQGVNIIKETYLLLS